MSSTITIESVEELKRFLENRDDHGEIISVTVERKEPEKESFHVTMAEREMAERPGDAYG